MWKDFQHEMSLYYWGVYSPREKTWLEAKLLCWVMRAQARKIWRRLTHPALLTPRD